MARRSKLVTVAKPIPVTKDDLDTKVQMGRVSIVVHSLVVTSLEIKMLINEMNNPKELDELVNFLKGQIQIYKFFTEGLDFDEFNKMVLGILFKLIYRAQDRSSKLL